MHKKANLRNKFLIILSDYNQFNNPYGVYTIDVLIQTDEKKSIALECLSKDTYEGELAYLEDLHKEQILKNAGFGYSRI